MLDYAFGNFTKVTIADKETSGDIETFQDEGAYVVLPAGVDFTQLECQISAAEAPAGTGKVSFDRWIEVLTAPPAPPAETPADGADGTPEAPADGADGTPEAQTDGSQPGADGTPEAQAGTTPVSADGTQPETDGTDGEGSTGSDGDSGKFGNAAGEDDALFGSERAGTIVYTYAGQEAGHAAVVLNQSYFGQEPEMEWTPADGSKRGESSPAKLGRFSTRQMIVAGGAAVLLIVVLCIGLNRRKRAQERKRRNRKNEKTS